MLHTAAYCCMCHNLGDCAQIWAKRPNMGETRKLSGMSGLERKQGFAAQMWASPSTISTVCFQRVAVWSPACTEIGTWRWLTRQTGRTPLRGFPDCYRRPGGGKIVSTARKTGRKVSYGSEKSQNAIRGEGWKTPVSPKHHRTCRRGQ